MQERQAERDIALARGLSLRLLEFHIPTTRIHLLSLSRRERNPQHARSDAICRFLDAGDRSTIREFPNRFTRRDGGRRGRSRGRPPTIIISSVSRLIFMGRMITYREEHFVAID
eukprot:6182730-Pleurochrysis_carterae.AAC.2